MFNENGSSPIPGYYCLHSEDSTDLGYLFTYCHTAGSFQM